MKTVSSGKWLTNNEIDFKSETMGNMTFDDFFNGSKVYLKMNLVVDGTDHKPNLKQYCKGLPYDWIGVEVVSYKLDVDGPDIVEKYVGSKPTGLNNDYTLGEWSFAVSQEYKKHWGDDNSRTYTLNHSLPPPYYRGKKFQHGLGGLLKYAVYESGSITINIFKKPLP